MRIQFHIFFSSFDPSLRTKQIKTIFQTKNFCNFFATITNQAKTRQNRTGQDRTGQDRTGQDRTGQEEKSRDKDPVEDEMMI